MRLTDMTVQKLPVPERGQKFYADDHLSGFGVRVSQGGSRTFLLIIGKERQHITLGRYLPGAFGLAQAREKAKAIMAQRQLGIVEKPTPLFETVREEYLSRRDTSVRASTRQADNYYFKHVTALSKKKLRDITPEEIDDLIAEIPYLTTRRHAFLRLKGLFGFAVKRGYLDASPMDRLDCTPQGESRDRVLSDGEFRAVILAARAYPHSYGKILELLALTGQRRQMIGSLRREFIDWEKRLISFPPEIMKAKKRHVIPFGPMVEAVLKSIPEIESGFFFPSVRGTGFVGWSYHKARFDEMCGVKDFHIHDLRRVLATRWQEMGVEIATTEKYLAHSAITGGLVGVYQRSTFIAQMSSAVRNWEDLVEVLLSE